MTAAFSQHLLRSQEIYLVCDLAAITFSSCLPACPHPPRLLGAFPGGSVKLHLSWIPEWLLNQQWFSRDHPNGCVARNCLCQIWVPVCCQGEQEITWSLFPYISLSVSSLRCVRAVEALSVEYQFLDSGGTSHNTNAFNEYLSPTLSVHREAHWDVCCSRTWLHPFAAEISLQPPTWFWLF